VAGGFAAANWLLAVPEVLYCLRGSRVTARDYFGAAARPLAAAAMAAVVALLVERGAGAPGVDLAQLALSSAAFAAVYVAGWIVIPGRRHAAGDLRALWRASVAPHTSSE